MARILAIDCDRDSCVSLERDLLSLGHRLLVAATCVEGVRLARAKRPALVLVGRRLSENDGLGVCKTLKCDPATERIPILLLADRADEIDRVVARELGVVGYLVKPITRAELIARVEATSVRPPVDPSETPQQLGCLTLSACGRQATVEGRRIDLTPVEIALLLVLCEGSERVHSRVELLERVWGAAGWDETRLVDQYVKRLRQKLGRAGLYIETVRGVGYRFAKGRAGGEPV